MTDLERERAHWRTLAIARGRILVAYRVGGRPAEGATDDARRAVGALLAMGIDPTTGKRREVEHGC